MSLSIAPDIRPGRLDAAEYARRFADATPRLTGPQAVLEAERCLYCFDAPCATACPTHIDVPSFIRRIADGNLRGSAAAILQANPLGGMCARVCPTENLCEVVCVRNTQAVSYTHLDVYKRQTWYWPRRSCRSSSAPLPILYRS